jgi:hypothetical protein
MACCPTDYEPSARLRLAGPLRLVLGSPGQVLGAVARNDDAIRALRQPSVVFEAGKRRRPPGPRSARPVTEASPWFRQARSDARTAQALTSAPEPMRPTDVACHVTALCAQTVEKALKGYLILNRRVARLDHRPDRYLRLLLERDGAFPALSLPPSGTRAALRYPNQVGSRRPPVAEPRSPERGPEPMSPTRSTRGRSRANGGMRRQMLHTTPHRTSSGRAWNSLGASSMCSTASEALQSAPRRSDSRPAVDPGVAPRCAVNFSGRRCGRDLQQNHCTADLLRRGQPTQGRHRRSTRRGRELLRPRGRRRGPVARPRTSRRPDDGTSLHRQDLRRARSRI